MTNIYFQKTHQRAFGTYPLTQSELADALSIAIDAGYRAIDTAQMYENEADVGEALKRIDVPREDLLITTKVHPDYFTEEAFMPSVETSLRALGIDQADVLLLHWPPMDGDIAPSLTLLEQAQKNGLARHIGVSNYTAQMMRDATKIIETPLVINQVEFHPLLNQDVLLAAAVETGIPLSSYCSVARGEVFKHGLFSELGEIYEKSAAQVVLRWILQKGVPITTMSTKSTNINANFDVMDFSLSNVDMARIDALGATNYRIVDESLVPWAPKWD